MIYAVAVLAPFLALFEHVAQKWAPVLREQHATKQKLRAPDLIQSD
jgi:hypothetical protein